MKFALMLIVYAAITLILGPIWSYWVLMLFWAITGALFGGGAARAFFSAALAVGLVWIGQSFWITWSTASPLPEKMGEIIGGVSKGILMGITGVMGFLIGGMSALTGNRFRKLFEKKRPYYFRG